jgi:hypothetical protein
MPSTVNVVVGTAPPSSAASEVANPQTESSSRTNPDAPGERRLIAAGRELVGAIRFN